MRKNIRKTVSLLLTAAMLLPLVGCAGTPELPPQAEELPQTTDAQASAKVEVRQLAAPVYPDAEAASPLTPSDRQSLFFRESMAQFLGDLGEENRVYSPLNVYLALAMLAETADGDSRAQILSLLGADSVETLRTQAVTLWQAAYADSETAKTLLGSSLWMRDDMPYNAQTLQNLADYYYAAAFSGRMGSEDYNKALQDWINEQTGGLLSDQTDGLSMNPNTVLSLVTTLYYKAPWLKQFAPESTQTEVFHTPQGDRDCAYLCESQTNTYYVGTHFTAVGKALEGGTMYLLLPNEGITPAQLLHDPQALSFLSGSTDGVDAGRYMVHLKLPKFDVSSQLSLIDGLKSLGVTDVFDESVADFSPLTEAVRDIYVSQVDHGARVKIDEEGCEAAAYTMISLETRAARPIRDEVDFTLDRPFLFGVVTEGGLPLFTGVVNRPIE